MSITIPLFFCSLPVMAELAPTQAGSSLKCSTGAFLYGRPCHPGIKQTIRSGANLIKKVICYFTNSFMASSTSPGELMIFVEQLKKRASYKGTHG